MTAVPTTPARDDPYPRIAQALQAGRLEEAESLLRAKEAAGAKEAEWHHLAGVLEFRRGRAQAALARLDVALCLQPDHPHALNNRGSLLRIYRRWTEAEACHRRAMELAPHQWDFVQNRALCLQDLRRHDEAAAMLRGLVEANPKDALAWFSLGISLGALGRGEEEEACHRRAVEADSGRWDAALNLGVRCASTGRLEEAERWYRRARELKPDEPVILFNLANLLSARREASEAEALLREAVRLKPDFAEAWVNLGNLLRRRQQLREAFEALQRVYNLQPTSLLALNGMAVVLRDMRQINDAERLFREVLRRDPNYVPAMVNLGHLLRRKGSLAEAETLYRRAVAREPHEAEAWNGLGLLHADEGRLDEAVTALRRASDEQPANLSYPSNLLYVQTHQGVSTPEEILEEAKRWERRLPSHQRLPLRAPRRSRLRIGYVSADFRRHAVSYFIGPVLSAHNRERVEVYAFSNVAAPDAQTESLRRRGAQWERIEALDDDAAARLIREREIDVLVDLSGHTQGNRLGVFARKPAPVQATWLGYFGTTGLSAMDHWITDGVLHPESLPVAASETVWRLPRCWVCYEGPDAAPPVGMAERSGVVFGSFNNLAKISAITLDLWARVLAAVPDSTLLLKNVKFEDERCRERISRELRVRGVDDKRVQFGFHSARLEDHLAAYAGIDIALDTHPYTGATTTADALWMGVPTVTLPGTTYASRMSASLLVAAGLPDLLAGSPEEYVTTAMQCAAELQGVGSAARLELRRKRREAMAQSSLCDARAMTGALEEAYEAMVARV